MSLESSASQSDLSRPGRPWRQMFITILASGLCLTAFAKLLGRFFPAIADVLQGIGALGFVGGVLGWLISLLRDKRMERLGVERSYSQGLGRINFFIGEVWALLLLTSILLPFVVGNRSPSTASENADSKAATAVPTGTQEPRILLSADQRFTITVPASWRPQPADVEIGRDDIAATDEAKEIYAAVWTDPKEDIASSGVEPYAQALFTEMSKNIQGLTLVRRSVTHIPQPTVVDMELTGSIESTNITYLIRVTEASNSYVRVVVWSTPSKIRENPTVLQQIIESFRGT